MNKDINFVTSKNLYELLEEHKKITHPYKSYEFDSTSYTLLIYDINQMLKENTNLKQENKILKENAENNDKVVDKVNWDNRLLKQALNEIREICYGSDMSKQEYDKVLQIIDKYTKEDD